MKDPMGAKVRDKNTQPDESLDLELEALIAAVDQLTQDHPNERPKELLIVQAMVEPQGSAAEVQQ